jgi:hypothetical protein
MEKNSQQWLDVIDRCVPAFLRGLARDNAGVRGSGTYLQAGESRTGCTASPRHEAASRSGRSPHRRDHQHIAGPTPTEPDTT